MLCIAFVMRYTVHAVCCSNNWSLTEATAVNSMNEHEPTENQQEILYGHSYEPPLFHWGEHIMLTYAIVHLALEN